MRSRELRPGFFKNPELARCEPHARLAFEALWLLADRAGRLEDRPDKIRAEAFPFEPELDADALLWQLHREGLAVRYRAATGHELIELPTFHKHQRPYTKEPESLWLGADDEGSTVRAPNTHENSEEKQSSPPVSCLLSPVSCLPPPGGGGSVANVKQLALDGVGPPLKDARKGKTAETSQREHVAHNCPHELIRHLWRQTLPTLPAPSEPWRETHARYLRARWREEATEHGWTSLDDGLQWFRALFAYIGRSRFLTGRTGPRRAHVTTFECTLEWLVKLEHWINVQQGQYHDQGVSR